MGTTNKDDYMEDGSRLAEFAKRIGILEAQNKLLRAKNHQLRLHLLDQSQRRAEVEKRLSIHPQSGLPTHYRMNTELGEIIEENTKDGVATSFALVILQLDNSYDMIKKTLKSSLSEWVLYQFSSRLRDNLGRNDKIFHTRENEFILVIFGQSLDSLEIFLKKLSLRVMEPHIFSGFNLALGCSMGVSVFPDHGIDKGLLLHHADIALGSALEQKRDVVLYRDALKEEVIERMELQNSIIKAIEAPALAEIGHQFEIYFQPKLKISGLDSEYLHIGGLEAECLIRWHHPVKGLIPPSKFIPIAEETGLIMPIGKWSLFQILKKMENWHLAGRDPVGISINISPRQFKSGDLVEIMGRNLDITGVPAQLITVELTETTLFEDPLQAINVIDQLKEKGIKISVDDFGTGYSSLSHLHKFPLDEIKIDQSFIREFPENRQDKAIVASLAAIAKELKLKLVAEGVEKLEQLVDLAALGCDIIQGYFFSKPLPEKDFLEFVDKLKAQGMRWPIKL